MVRVHDVAATVAAARVLGDDVALSAHEDRGGSAVKGKWAQGIVPRNFTWVIKDRLAVSERPGGYGPEPSRVRRQEEIIWIRQQGFTSIVSLLASPHNLHAYAELDVAYQHLPFGLHDEPATVLATPLPRRALPARGGGQAARPPGRGR
jgi:hypothetical protein